MEANRSWRVVPLLLWAAMVAMFSHNLVVVPVMSAASFEDQKNYYPPDPNTPTPTAPNLPTFPPPHGSGGGSHPTPTPSHGSTPPYHASTPPYHAGTPPYHGGSPPANCGHPPPTGSGGHHHTTPSPPTSGGGGGYYHSPPTTTPITPITPITPTPLVPSPPPPAATITPPIIIPGTPSITVPSPPFSFDPNSPPFTCTYWLNHPTLIWGLFGFWGTTIGTAFGSSSLPGFGANTNIIQALSNTRTDGLGQLYREGTAALLNSMAHARFPYTTSQVRDSFLAAVGSNQAAAAQAQLFRMANEGRTEPRT